MRPHWGPGPVFAHEWRLASRRWQMYAVRAGVVTALFAVLYLVWRAEVAGRPRVTELGEYYRLGQAFGGKLMLAQLGILVLLAPAATAGALARDKVDGTLLPLLVTDLSDAEIVLGKLAARLVPLLGLFGCCLPVLFLSTLFGGIEPKAVLAASLVTLAVVVLSTTVSVAVSVWARRPYEVVLATYFFGALVLFAGPIGKAACGYWGITQPAWLDSPLLSPFALARAAFSAEDAPDLGGPVCFLGCSGLAGLALTLMAIRQIRTVGLAQAAKPAGKRSGSDVGLRARRRWLPGPALDRNPVLWWQWRQTLAAPWARVLWIGYAVFVLVGSVLLLEWLADNPTPWAVPSWVEWLGGWEPGPSEGYRFPALANVLLAGLGLFLVAVSSVTALAEHRAGRCLDLLLATPLPTRAIVRGLWGGAYRAVLYLAVVPCVPVAFFIWTRGNWWGALLFLGLFLAYGAVLVSLGLALATWTSRPGLAMLATAAGHLILAGGWLRVVLWSFQVDRSWGSVTPTALQAYHLTDVLGYGIGRAAEGTIWYVLWIPACLCVHAVLYYAVLFTFGRCLGRHGVEGVPVPTASASPIGWKYAGCSRS